jgi:hypothetical protein
VSKRQQPAKEQDKFIVRLPEGMRERIKSKADRANMSMNEAIVWCLEQYFPAPTTITDKLNELVEMVAILKGDDTYQAVDQLVAEVHDAIVALRDKRVTAPVDFRDAVMDRYARWQEEEAERQRDRHENPFSDELYGDPLVFHAPADPSTSDNFEPGARAREIMEARRNAPPADLDPANSDQAADEGPADRTKGRKP